MPPPFRPLRPLSGWVQGLAVALTIAFMAFVIGMSLFFVSVTQAANDGVPAAPEPGPMELWAFFALFMGEILLFAFGITQALVTGFWLMRGAENMRARGVYGASWSPGWAVGSWFIPYGNFVLGFLVCREVWRGSLPTAPQDPYWKTRPLPAWMAWWWGLTVAAPIVSMFVIFPTGMAAIFADMQWLPLAVMVLPLGMWTAALLLFARFVRELTAMQSAWEPGRAHRVPHPP